MATIRGGDKLQKKLDQILKDVKKNASKLEVGFMGGASYPDGTSVAMVAAINEFGAPSRGQPPRPFFRRMVATKSKEWPKALGLALKANNYDGRRAMNLMGVGISDQLKKSIIDLVSPPLSPRTVARKGFDKPLIETKLMLNSVTYKVS